MPLICGKISEAGASPLMGTLEYGEMLPNEPRYLYFIDTPGEDLDSITCMVTGGAQIIIFTSGRGTPTGSPLPP